MTRCDSAPESSSLSPDPLATGARLHNVPSSAARGASTASSLPQLPLSPARAAGGVDQTGASMSFTREPEGAPSTTVNKARRGQQRDLGRTALSQHRTRPLPRLPIPATLCARLFSPERSYVDTSLSPWPRSPRPNFTYIASWATTQGPNLVRQHFFIGSSSH
ncbi:hypothetical protein BD309DRAFT_405910 [Dichomitus squalens]|uniref:Uncharacterized protein n=1 Tax=Dichomitus squalens TaxID=114155 RepID=A0A4Q9NJK1_9APHY|nr:hypothetical protein BD309DRAFT_405910 [Dichomitus squalens]TBU52362.1 hypothetical protein BD310DRAFT_241262 [Dichomitus squalens]